MVTPGGIPEGCGVSLQELWQVEGEGVVGKGGGRRGGSGHCGEDGVGVKVQAVLRYLDGRGGRGRGHVGGRVSWKLYK